MAKMGRIDEEKRTVGLMIGIYCRKKHIQDGDNAICAQCKELREYSNAKLDECAFEDRKGPCKSCTIHCYEPGMREYMRKVMRFSGPRIVFRHPIISLKYLIVRWDE